MSAALLLIVAGLALLGYGLYLLTREDQNQGNRGTGAQHDPSAKGSQQPETKGDQQISSQESWYGPVCIYYSSQTGTAAKFAKSLCKDLKEARILGSVACISECSIAKLKADITSLHIFIVATHYEGEAPDDMQEFWKELKSESEKGRLQGLKYTGFALGDLNYKYFCQTGRLLNKKLEVLGGQLVYVFGEGSNDQGRIHEYFEEWAIPVSPVLIGTVDPIPSDVSEKLLLTLDDGSYTIALDPEYLTKYIPEPHFYDPATAVDTNLSELHELSSRRSNSSP